jgi:hypothetical protein
MVSEDSTDDVTTLAVMFKSLASFNRLR